MGTRAVNQPYQTQVNGYQTVCQGCFAPFPYGQPSDPRFGAVTQLSTGANSHYNGLQLTADKRLAHGLQAQVNYTWSHCMDTVSNGGFLPFSAGGILSPLPGDLARQYGPCDYDVRHNLTAQYVYQLPLKVRNRTLGGALNGWQVSGTAFWHSGLPFSVLSTPYSANGDGIVEGSGPQYASVVPGAPLYAHHPISGVTPAGTMQWLNPDAFVSAVDPGTGACTGGDNPQNCQFGNLGRNALRGPDFVVGRFLSDQVVHVKRACEASRGRPVFQRLESSELRASDGGLRRHPRKTVHADGFRSAHVYYLATDWTARRGAGRRQLAADDCVSGAPGVLIRENLTILLISRIDPRAIRICPDRSV